MLHLPPFSALLLAAALVLVAPVSHAQDDLRAAPPVRYETDWADNAFHAGRRQALLQQLPDTALALLFSAPVRKRDNDIAYEYRQSSDLYYLSGTHEPNSVLLLSPHGVEVDGRIAREVLFVPERTDYSETWLGRRFGPRGAEEMLGIDVALPSSQLDEVLREEMEKSSPLLFVLPLPNALPQDADLAQQYATVVPYLREQPDAAAQSLRLRRSLDALRTVKHPEELRLMQHAADITVEALRAAMIATEPGMHEYELEAVIEYVFHREGAESPAFPSIVGSGENGVILHYESNRRQMEAGDLVLMDVGAEYHYYPADVTRTIPVGGIFSQEQEALYQLVLDAQESGIEAARAGNAFSAPHEAAKLVLERGLFELGLMQEGDDVMDYLLHATSHYLGLSVHDVGSSSAQLVPGSVITVEPGLYIRPSAGIDRRWWNMGIRIEDDVLVTDGDPVVLSDEAPKTVDEIEALMANDCTALAPEC